MVNIIIIIDDGKKNEPEDPWELVPGGTVLGGKWPFLKATSAVLSAGPTLIGVLCPLFFPGEWESH